MTQNVRKLSLTNEAHDFIKKLDAKHFKQVMNRVLGLLGDPSPADSSALKGYADLFRIDQGEYRIVYRFDEESVSVLVVDKRNDDEVYKVLARKKL